MHDLNAVDTLETGWHNLEFWMDSVHYWTRRMNQVDEEFKATYQHSIDQAWMMVDAYLLPLDA
jgi:hypothetical protein